jgi:copper chaperone CopZ
MIEVLTMTNILKLDFSGIDCPSCAQDVIDEIKKAPGVDDARLNYPAGKIYVTARDGADFRA